MSKEVNWPDLLSRVFEFMRVQATKDLYNNLIVLKEGESGSLLDDEELTIDQLLGTVASTFLKLFAERVFRSIEVEGFGTEPVNPDGLYDAKVDPLDATLYYKHRQPLKGFFPYGGVITIVKAVEKPEFSDIVAAGIMNYVSGDLWLAEGESPTLINGYRAEPYIGEFGLTKIPVIAEMYYPENRGRLVEAFGEEKGYLRSPGCAAVEMASVSSGQTAAFVCISQKGHELGAAYRIVKNAGGVVVDWNGNSLDHERYIFNAQYPVILGCNLDTALQIIRRLEQN